MICRPTYNSQSCRLLFLWLAVPWLQAELDSWVAQFNSTQRRKDKHKILPQGIPDLVTRKPERYQMLDFKVRGVHFPSVLPAHQMIEYSTLGHSSA